MRRFIAYPLLMCLVLASPARAVAVGRGRMVYIGGSLAINERTEGLFDLQDRDKLFFRPEGSPFEASNAGGEAGATAGAGGAPCA